MTVKQSLGARIGRLLMVVVVLCLLGLVLYGLHRWTERFDVAQAQLAASLAEQDKQRGQLEQALAHQEQVFRQQLATQQAALDEHQRLLSQLARISQDDWRVREAQALTALAERRLQLTGDHEGAVRLLTAALDALALTSLPQDSPARAALRQDVALLQGWYQAARHNLRSALDTAAAAHGGVFRSAQQLTPEPATAAPEEAGWRGWLARLPLSFSARQQVPLNLSTSQVQQRLGQFRLLLTQAEMAGLMQRYGDQQRLLDEAAQLTDALTLADADQRLVLLQALEDARQHALSLEQGVQLQSPAALVDLLRGG